MKTKTLSRIGIAIGVLPFVFLTLSASAQSSGGQIKGTVVDVEVAVTVSLTEEGDVAIVCDSEKEFSGRITLLASEDLRDWRPVGVIFDPGSTPIAILDRDRQVGGKMRYYRAAVAFDRELVLETENASEAAPDRGAIDRVDFVGLEDGTRASGGSGSGLPGGGEGGAIAPPVPYPSPCGDADTSDSTGGDTDTSGPGTLTGVTSSGAMGPITPVKASFCVKVEHSAIRPDFP